MIITLSGFINSGKDTVADYLCSKHNFKKISFADSLKDTISIIFGWDRELLSGSSVESREWREQIDPWWSKRLGIPHLTPRWVMQYWATEVCRNHFHTDIWVASVEHKLLHSDEDIVITDCRFLNEFNTVKNVGGITMRISRGPNPDWYDAALSFNRGKEGNNSWAASKEILARKNVHPSEYSSVGLEYDYFIENDGSLDQLYRKIDGIVSNIC